MTVPASPAVNSSTGNGVTTVFPYTFRILAASDLEVTIDGAAKTLGVDYTVDGVGNNTGGNVTFLAAPPSGTVTRRRNMPLARSTDYTTNGDLLAGALNTDQDAPVLMVQQVQEQVDRSIKVPVGDANPVLPAASVRANKAIVFGADGGVTVSVDDYNDQVAAVTALANAAAVSQAAAAGSQADAAASKLSAANSDTNAAASLAAVRGIVAGGITIPHYQKFTGAGPYPITNIPAMTSYLFSYVNGLFYDPSNFSAVGQTISYTGAMPIPATAVVHHFYL